MSNNNNNNNDDDDLEPDTPDFEEMRRRMTSINPFENMSIQQLQSEPRVPIPISFESEAKLVPSVPKTRTLAEYRKELEGRKEELAEAKEDLNNRIKMEREREAMRKRVKEERERKDKEKRKTSLFGGRKRRRTNKRKSKKNRSRKVKSRR